MADFAVARQMMVDGQVRTSDVTDLRIIAAMQELPRERFVPEGRAGLAYLDLALPVAESTDGRPTRRMLPPMILAKLIQAADIQDTDHVLDVGCATGYSAAVLGRLAASVVALEEDPGLARLASAALNAVQAGNVTVVAGPLTTGWQQQAPYDVIFVNGAIEVLPPGLAAQLKDGGRFLCVRESGPAGKAMIYRSDRGAMSGRPIFDAAAPMLPGFAAPAQFVF
jgi:protein-L-isoaspartate(D-aspartate) O-methyltransferase